MVKISVIIPAYNTAKYVRGALESVFAQTFEDFEVIVINDGSPDTEALEDELRPYLERVVYLKQENQGPSAARNLGIRSARGKYLAFLDSDDSWFPQYLSEQMQFLRKSGPLDMVYSDALLWGDTPLCGKSFFEIHPPRVPVTFANLLKGCSILPSHVVVRKDVVLDAGLFDEGLHLLEDVDLWLRIVHRGGAIACNNTVLARHLYHPGSVSHDKDEEMESTQLQLMRNLEASLDLQVGARKALAAEISCVQGHLAVEAGKRFLAAGDFSSARSSFEEASAIRPSMKLKYVVVGLRAAPRLVQLLANVWRRLLRNADNLDGTRRRLGRPDHVPSES